METAEKTGTPGRFVNRTVCYLRENWNRILMMLLSLSLFLGFVWYCLRYSLPEETALRQHIVHSAENYLGYAEADGSHRQIIDLYNARQPRPRDYEVTYEDSWCAVFGTVIAAESGLADVIPPECSCEQQINLFSEAGCWMETDWYLPKPGDYIYYDWNYKTKGDSRGWSDHVGIVVRTFGPVIQVIEGNKDDRVTYRFVFLNDPTIRGFGLPDYSSHLFP